MAVPIRSCLLLILFAGLASQVRAQDPPPDPQATVDAAPVDASTTQPQTDRIVDDRPPMYAAKRLAHPLTWLELAVRPMAHSAQHGRIHGLLTRKPMGPVRFGAGGSGAGSGFGPLVTFTDKNFLNRGIELEVPLLYTYKRYELYRFNASVPLSQGGSLERLSLDFQGGYASRPQDDFFGLGNDSVLDDESNFRTVSRDLGVGLSATVNDEWKTGIRGVYRTTGVTNPSRGVSVQDFFNESSTPGLSGATLGSAVFWLGRDTVRIDNRTFSGSADQFEMSFNRDLSGKDFEYLQYRVESRHFVPLSSDGRKVLAFRGVFETNQTPDGQSMPFFEMPTLGSASNLRGFQNMRFRDRNALALSLEYRYRIWTAMDWGFFVDGGQVAPRLRDFALDRFHPAVGTRFFIWAKPTFPISVDIGRSRESWRLYINFNPKF